MMFTKRDLRRLIGPLIIEQVLLVVVGMADTLMISSLGEGFREKASRAAEQLFLFITATSFVIMAVNLIVVVGCPMIVSAYNLSPETKVLTEKIRF